MAVSSERLVRSDIADDDPEQAAVDALARSVEDRLRQLDAAISSAHVFGAQSKVIQDLIEAGLSGLGFESEVVLTPQQGFVTRATPDFVFRMGDGRGVIAEVERGGAVNNNHDLKDMWKIHVAPDAHHLFLIVPHSNWKEDGSAREKPYARVVARFRSFFGEPRRELDVASCHIFGYGGTAAPGMP